ncbi:MAG: hypothetical protein OSP8Acid_00900 [uncultured Acidilobus sp. OSP8]|nr:MAG: hypothetical protein OSP8Acid_00900 [uncultured Acidilobus sp. OSP8]
MRRAAELVGVRRGGAA